MNLPGYVPAIFTAPYYTANGTNAAAGSLIYTGTVLITNAPVTETYAGDLRMVRIAVTWTSGNITHQRRVATFVSQYGMQKYIY